MNVKNCLSHDEDDEKIAEIHPQAATPTQGQQETPLRRNESASPSTPRGGNSSASSSTCTPNERVVAEATTPTTTVFNKDHGRSLEVILPINRRKELKFLEDLFKEYGVRYVTLAKMVEMGFTANALVNMTEEEIEDLMKTFVELYHMDLLIGERYGIKSLTTAEKEHVADILTKPLNQKSFEFLMKCLGMTDNSVVDIKGEC